MFRYDETEFRMRLELAQIEKAALVAYDAKPLAAERARRLAGYGGVTPFGRTEPTKYDNEEGRRAFWRYLHG